MVFAAPGAIEPAVGVAEVPVAVLEVSPSVSPTPPYAAIPPVARPATESVNAYEAGSDAPAFRR